MVLLVLIEQGSLICMFLQSTETAATLVLNYLETKGASNADAKILIKIDDKGVDYAEVANNMIQEYYLLTLAETIDLWK
jgi:hypothetical protein